jgi:methylated-DNA-[protein]-cysteine S-methyltransferase
MSIYQTQSSPLGELLLVGEETKAGVALTSVSLPGRRNAPDIGVGWQRAPEAFALVTRQLEEYFASERIHFDLVLAPNGTPFQQRIWQALDSVRYGTTITYGELATQLGVPRDRIVALGAAVGANPLLIVRPCHRVIGADGTMRGYAGGVERKQWLLVHEGILLPEFA